MKKKNQKGLTPLEVTPALAPLEPNRASDGWREVREKFDRWSLTGLARRSGLRGELFLTGFTLIELLVVISVIGLLASVVMVSLNAARDKAKLAKAKQDIQTLSTAMLAYKGDVGELPSRGDLCSYCLDAQNKFNSSWTLVIDALIANDGANWAGPYLGGRIDLDPWGSYYGYDDNDCMGTGQNAQSYLASAGPDKLGQTSDDYYVIIFPAC